MWLFCEYYCYYPNIPCYNTRLYTSNYSVFIGCYASANAEEIGGESHNGQTCYIIAVCVYASFAN